LQASIVFFLLKTIKGPTLFSYGIELLNVMNVERMKDKQDISRKAN